MSAISFDLGVKEYSVNGSYTLMFNPTDMSYVEKVFSTFEALDGMQESFSTKLTEDMNGEQLFNVTREMDKEMRAVLDEMFGADFCKEVFKTLHVYAIADGLPVWCNLMLAIVDELDASFVAEKKKTNPRIQKYISKYTKK